MRFNSLTKEELKKIKNYLIKKNAEKILLDPYKIKNLVIYGAGTIATDIIKKQIFLNKYKERIMT